MRRFILAVIVTLAVVLPVRAWSFKEHIQLTRLAAGRIVADPSADASLKDWLKRHVDLLDSIEAERQYMLTARVGANPPEGSYSGLLWAVLVPDIEANKRGGPDVEPFGAHERLMHYIDLELLNTGDRPRDFKADLSALPPLSAVPRNMKDERLRRAGYLPFALEHAYKKLVESIRAGRLDESAGPDNAVRWAGYLLHYAQDNTQPHHATVDYKSASFFGSRPDAPNVHSEVEWRPVDDAKDMFPDLRNKIWAGLERELRVASDPVTSDKPFDATLEVSFASYRYLPLIGRAAVAASHELDGSLRIDTEKFYAFEGEVDGVTVSMVEMKSRQLAWAVLRGERLLRAAWAEATR